MKIYILLIILLTFTSCYEMERNCSDFKTGTFEFTYTIDGIEKKGTINRTEDLQVETYENKTDSTKVRWVNDCEVIFKTINPKNMAERKDIHLKILTTTANSYTFEYSYVGETKKQKGTAYKLK